MVACFSSKVSGCWFLLVILACSIRFHVTEGTIAFSVLCASQSVYEKCLETNDSCAWCSEWTYTNSSFGKPRCNTRDTLAAFGCPTQEIRTAPPGSVEILENADFQDVIIDQTPVQLKPQKIRLMLGPRSSKEIRLQFRPARNHPLDLYYLMDLTLSMKDDKDTLVGLGARMANTLDTFTTNYRLGFGSYADKPLMPSVFPGHEDNPCRSDHSICAPLYSFRHRLGLTDNFLQFIQEVNDSAVTANSDNVEGGLDGVVQAIVCKKQIGWTPQARKLMLIATDGYMHFAGDGKLGGVVKRNDFSCHLDATGNYFLSKELDYPSLAEISQLLQEHKVNLIFAVTEELRAEYEQMSKLLKEKSNVGILTSNSSNILEIIKRAYHDIVTKVVLRDNSTSPLRVEYFSTCGDEEQRELPTSECGGIQEGRIYDFRIVISLDHCPKNESLWKQTIIIDDALASEASEVQLELELLCGSDCKDLKSLYCKHGVNDCGICKCDFGWSGETCDCDVSSPIEKIVHCIQPNTSKVCSDKGECICGECSCDLGYNGQFCECSPCDKTDGIECGGRGTCRCGVCECLKGWSGDGCECPTGNELCIAPGSVEVCADHGYCDCGQCRCNVTSADGLLYRGTYCESSAGAGGSGLCKLYDACVNATVEATEDMANEMCHTHASRYKVERVSTVNTGDEHYCFIRTTADDTSCLLPYVYEFGRDNSVTLKIAEKICRIRMHAAFLPGLLCGSILLAGILGLLVWKCWTGIQDAREYAKFEKERQNTVYALDENPIYRPATMRFRVPSMYNQD